MDKYEIGIVTGLILIVLAVGLTEYFYKPAPAISQVGRPEVSSIIKWEDTIEKTIHWRPINKPLSNELFTVRLKLPLNYTYSLQRSMDDGQWIIYGSTADTFMVVEMNVGHSYIYRVGAHDSTGIHYSEPSEEYTP